MHGNSNVEIGTNKFESNNSGSDDEKSSNEGIDEAKQERNNAVAGIKHCIVKSPDL